MVLGMLCNLLAVHPVHLSLTSIDFNSETKALEITHRFFVDDFEKRLEQDLSERLYLGTEEEYSEADKVIQEYLKQNFTILVNGKELSRNYIGKEVDAEAIWIYVEIPQLKKLKDLELTHLSLLDFFEDQRNFINVNYEGEKKAIILDAQKATGNISFR